MIYCCKKCQREISNDITKVFISDGGYALCSNCSIGEKPCDEDLRRLIEDDHNLFFNYEINYIYIFSNEMIVDRINVPSNEDYRITGFKEKQSPFLIGAMANDFKYSYAHQFKCNETLTLGTNVENGNLDMHIGFDDAIKNCEYISFIGGLESNFD